MTEEECWRSIEAYTLAGDWNGLLVCADWLQENEQEELAGTIRWANKREELPNKRRKERRSDTWHFKFPIWYDSTHQLYAMTCRLVWLLVNEYRADVLEFYT